MEGTNSGIYIELHIGWDIHRIDYIQIGYTQRGEYKWGKIHTKWNLHRVK